MMRAAILAAAFACSITGLVLTKQEDGIDLLYVAMLLAFGGTGYLIAGRQPRNPIGWLFLGCALAAGVAPLAHGIIEAGGRSGALAAYSSASWIPFMLPGLTFLPLLFPDGRLLSRRWRPVAWCAAAGIFVSFIGVLLRPGPTEDYPGIENPLGVAGAEGLESLGFVLLFVALVGGPVSLIVRYRRSDRIARQQIRWLALASAVGASVLVVGVAALWAGAPDVLIYVPMMLTVVALPLATAVAIMRYRLYDIDLVVNRALVYGALTGALALTYLVAVLLASLVLPASSDLAVAVSTLAVAAAFRPARARIQAAVDRRFFRSRYDAERVLAYFGGRLREQVDLTAVSAELRSAVAESVHPAYVSLWLRP